MPKQLDAAREHVRLMEDRIAQQSRVVEELRKSGEDDTEAIRRLELLKSVLTEMRLQLGQLAETDADKKRKAAPPKMSKRPRGTQEELMHRDARHSVRRT
jgi:uncharacterized membrane protein YccC